MPQAKILLTLLFFFIGAFNFLGAEEQFKYSYIPKQIYTNQIFPITLLETNTSKDIPQFLFEADKRERPLFEKPLIIKNGNDSFYTFYFKASNGHFSLPRLTIVENNVSIYLDAAKIPLAKLKPMEDFCGVLAAEMKIKTSQASTFDEKNNLITLSIEAFEANLENMHLHSNGEDGIENIKRKGAKVKGDFYAVLPSTQKNLSFTYFNTIKEQYVTLQTPITIKDFSVSTQSELNPKDDHFGKAKKILFIGFASLFFLLFLWKRDFFYLVLALISVIILLTFYTPQKSICIQEGASLYILPTSTSRISTTIKSQFDTVLLGKRNEFNKIEYKDQAVGWVKDEDLCKN